jgi:uncharacterized membrane protein YtjA (UPF0391 family)
VSSGGAALLYYALMFLVVALICGVLGFAVLAATAALVAKVLLFVFLVLFLFALLSGRRRVL